MIVTIFKNQVNINPVIQLELHRRLIDRTIRLQKMNDIIRLKQLLNDSSKIS